jgi:hypothetical protein
MTHIELVLLFCRVFVSLIFLILETPGTLLWLRLTLLPRVLRKIVS